MHTFPKFKVKWLFDSDLGVTLLFILPKGSVFRELSTMKSFGKIYCPNFRIFMTIVSPVHSLGIPMRNLSKK